MNVFAYARDNLAGAWQVLLGRPDVVGLEDGRIGRARRLHKAVVEALRENLTRRRVHDERLVA